MDQEAQSKLKEESKSWFENEARPLLEKSFKHHDKRNVGVLNKEEASTFFSNMVSKETMQAKAMSALSIEAAIKMSFGQLEARLTPEQREELKPQIEEQILNAVETAKVEVQKKEDRYMENKSACDAAAFKVLDANSDGTIE